MPLVNWILQNLEEAPIDGVFVGGSAMVYSESGEVSSGGVLAGGHGITDEVNFVVVLSSCPADTCASKGKVGFACLNRSTNTCDCASSALIPPKTGLVRINTSLRSVYYRRRAVLPSIVRCISGGVR